MAFVSSCLCTLITSLSECCKYQKFYLLQKLVTESLMKEKSIKALGKVPYIRLLGIMRGSCPLP